MRRGSDIEGTQVSDWAGSSGYDFMGPSRYLFLEAEIERSFGDFEVSQIILEDLIEFLLPEGLTASSVLLESIPLDVSVEYPDSGFVNWDARAGIRRIEQLKEANKTGPWVC